MKYVATYGGDIWRIYDTLEDLLKDEYIFKNLYQMASFNISKEMELSEEEKKIVDSRSWELKGWGYLPDPRARAHRKSK